MAFRPGVQAEGRDSGGTSMSDTATREQRNRIRSMFDAIAFRYDFLNHFLSLRRDVAWRRALVAALPCCTRLRILDLATGTGDVLLTLLKGHETEYYVVGADISTAMLRAAHAKIAQEGKERSSGLVATAAESLSFASGQFDIVTVAFGVRNFSDRGAGLAEMCRVLRPGGRALILEFGLPEHGLVRAAYLAYFRVILPLLAGLFSRQAEAYRYLNRSVEQFPDVENFCACLKQAGFQRTAVQRLTFGIATLYIAYKTH